MYIYIIIIFIIVLGLGLGLGFGLVPKLFDNTNSTPNPNPTLTPTLIPKIIIQTWKSHDIPEKYKSDMESIRKLNPDYTYLFFTDKDILEFITGHYPQYLNTFLKLPILIQKIDFFRYIAVYHYGGFYYDLDMKGLNSLDDLLNYECVFPIDTNINKYMEKIPRYEKYSDLHFLLGQYAFGAKPKHEFIKLLIDTIDKNIDLYISTYDTAYMGLMPGDKNRYVYSSTGPDFVTDVYMGYMNKPNIKILFHDINQYFGKYAKHNYYGTWK